MKKYVSVILVISIILSICLPALASDAEYIPIGEGETTVSAKNFFEYTSGGSNNASPAYGGNYFKYRLGFAKAGIYKVSIKNMMFSEGGTGTLFIDDVEVGNGTFELNSYSGQNNTAQITEFCTISVESGNHIFKYVNGSKAIYLSSFIFQYIGPRTDYNIKGNEFDAISATGITENKPTTGMNTGSYAEYRFDADESGTYGIFARVACVSGNSATVQASIDGAEIGNREFVSEGTGSGWGEAKEVYIGSAQLEFGEHTLRITAAKNAMRLIEIRLKAVHTELEQSFLASMKEASNHEAVKNVLDEYSDKLIISYDDYIGQLVYRKVFDSHLISLPYDSLLETDAQILSLLETELANPLIMLTQNGQNVTELSEGEFTVNIAARFEEELTAIAALYTDDGMQLEDYSSTKVFPYETASIKGLRANRNKALLKIFFIDNTTNLRPVELPKVMQTQIFVSKDGNDNDSGLPSKPLATIEGAVARVNELNAERMRDITVFLDGGEFVIDDTIVLSENFNSHDNFGVHFKSFSSSDIAVISGGYDVKGWNDADGDGIYTAQLPQSITDVRQLYIDDNPAQRARSDKYYFADNRWNNTENDIDENGKNTGYTEDGFDTYSSVFPKLRKPKDAELAYLILWTVQRLPVEDIVYESDGRTLIKMEQPYYSNALTMYCDGGIQPTIGQRFIIENDLTLLDEAGEFYFDKDTGIIYYMPFEEEDMTTARTVIAKTEQLITLKGSSNESKIKNITFDNIKFRYGGYYTKVNEEGAVSFQAENLANAAAGLNQNPVSTGVGRTLEAQITVENAEGIEFKNCDISCMGSSALRLGTAVTDSSVSGCIFTDIGGGAVSIGTWEGGKAIAEDITVENNVISRIGLDFMFCPALTIYYAKNASVLHNTIAHTPYSGISVGWGWAYDYSTTYLKDENGEYVLDDNGDKVVIKDYTKPSTANKLGVGGHNISYNRIYDISRTVVDGGHIYNLGFMTDSYVTNNYLTDSPDFAGVYLDSGASNVKIRKNVFERCVNDDVAFGRSPLVVGNVAESNWSDKMQSGTGTWTGEGCYFETPVVVSDGAWPQEAENVMNNAGVEADYISNLQRLASPQWRMLDHHDYPGDEALETGTIYVDAGSFDKYYIKPADSSNKTEAALFTYSGITGIGDFRWGEWSQYKVDIPKDGEYTFTVQYSRGGNGSVNVYLTEEEISEDYDYLIGDVINGINPVEPTFNKYVLPATNTQSTGYIPHTFRKEVIAIKNDNNETTGYTWSDENAVLQLSKGTYYLRFLNVGNGFSFSRFKFTPVLTDK